ncbi:DUF3618 domain-containing protein [Nonomuraea salmonea]|uniref:DUF3618 domain-containing protein n=2 Tax=Nonomuraea salmonea TaxID=46181 RepID=A0ABV5NQW8_9ACTN
MSETDPGYSGQHAGDVGARRATVGTPTDRESMNVPQTRPGAAENAHEAELKREGHETFIPETPIRDERAEADMSHGTEEASLRGSRGDRERRTSSRMSTQGAARGTGTRERRSGGATTEDELRREIEETRRELGATVGALAAKVNMKSRAGRAKDRAKARAKERAGRAAEAARIRAGHAAEVTKERTGHAAEVARERAGHAAEVTKERAGHAAELTRERAGHAAEVARERADAVKGRASHLADRARDSVPEPVIDVAKGRRPMVLMLVAGAMTAFALRRMMTGRAAYRRRVIEVGRRGDRIRIVVQLP